VKLGRPPLPYGTKKSAYAGFRVTPDLQRRIDEEAAANGRSRSREVEARIEASFVKQDVFQECLAAVKSLVGDVIVVND